MSFEGDMDVYEAQMLRMKQQAIAALNADLFSDGAGLIPPRRRSRLVVIAQRIGSYMSTLWRAVKGEDVYDY